MRDISLLSLGVGRNVFEEPALDLLWRNIDSVLLVLGLTPGIKEIHNGMGGPMYTRFHVRTFNDIAPLPQPHHQFLHQPDGHIFDEMDRPVNFDAAVSAREDCTRINLPNIPERGREEVEEGQPIFAGRGSFRALPRSPPSQLASKII
ncbi:hypothetical protein BDN72DRAFT_384501 [Pluteus cervinus]|uniref:Uncharacterized protein n=1 Tax=Pluteus cervinus TaxID=181527 RepID=A0ACD3AAB3_9AGAR|nr:hypothetical protein BDN72DRAFT_384501 [Pluteus cervinus]